MPSFGQNLASLRTLAIAEVNNAIGQTRSRYITVIPGQEMIYAEKEKEALEYIRQSGEHAMVPLDDFPLIASEVGITASTAYEVAQIVAYLGAAWRRTAAALDKLRLGAIRRIEETTSRLEIDAAVAELKTSLETFK
ncbi:hypothetical protein [Palleronia sp.]|uniref:hypothetical protein n=1 Tax=Palleronia sp. TaxID=1940284 RepID=UPI0035C7BE43